MLFRSIAAILLISAAYAAKAETVVQLSPEQREQALEAAAARPVDDLPINGLGSSRQIHGEVGFAVGTGGMRSVYGTVVAPIGDSGMASFSFEDGRYSDRRGRYGRSYY